MATARLSMPRMGTSVHEGTVIEWLKREGDEVQKGEPLLVAESEKVEFEVESPYRGRLAKILVSADTTVPVGETLALIETEEVVSAVEEELPTGVIPQTEEREAVERRGFLSPRVKRLAAEAGIGLEELSRIPGTGRGGRVTEEDLQRYLQERAKAPILEPSPEEAERVPLSRMRRRIAERMAESARTIPQVTTFDAADMSTLVAWRKEMGERFFARTGVHLTYTPFIARAVLLALSEPAFRALNSRWADDATFLFKAVHLGIAVALEDGLIVPVIRDAEGLPFVELARAIQLLSDRARQGDLRPEEATGGTFTITNVGPAGSLFATPLINPPEAAILAVGAIQKQVGVLADGSTAVRDRMGLSLTVDHRMVDGWVAARFNRGVCERLEAFDLDELSASLT
jgi:pyruvate/2-oxoglutarate dehydrogenase complex dihydrolipoamide acyltransferase (E2) component